MPTYAPANSDEDRHSTLQKIVKTSGEAIVEASLLPAATRAKIVTFLTTYTPVIHVLSDKMADRAQEVSEKDKAQALLETYVRDFYIVLKRRATRLQQNVAVLVHYGLPQSGDVPAVRSASDVVDAATKIVNGETAAVAAGFGPMSNPTAAEVAAVLASFVKESGEVVPADSAVREAEKAAADLRPMADELIDDAKSDLSHALRKESGPAQRRVLRLFGFKFTPNPGETPESDPTPTPIP
ncbi:MAG: hypothetical protein ABIT76_03720 [Chthoniobacterales bacterium]